MKPILEIQNVSKHFTINHQNSGYTSLRERIVNTFKFEKQLKEDFWALKDVSFEVNPGESIGIIGRNGAGKSTLLKVLSKITPPTKGRIISRGRVASLLEVGTGFHPELTGRENIFFNGSLLGMKRIEIESKFDEIVDFSGVEQFLDTPLKHYSSGMQLRLAFAVAAFLEPEILIIDEVLAVGDAEFQKKCLGKMEDVSKMGRTILFVSHNLNAVSTLCSSAVLLKNGQVCFKGDVPSAVSLYLTDDQDGIKSHQINSLELKNGVVLKNFRFNKSLINSFTEIEFSISIENVMNNPLAGLALLFYNTYQERVSILDLRSLDLFSISKYNKGFTLQGKISSLPFLDGEYQVGIYMDSHVCTGNFLDLIRIRIQNEADHSDIVPYPAQVRGFVQLNSNFTIDGRN